MKQFYLIISAALLIVAASCNKVDPAGVQGKVTVNITVGDLEPGTKAVKSGWENGDLINIWFDSRSSLTPDLTLTYNGSTWTASEMTAEVQAALSASGTFKGFWEATNTTATTGWGPRSNGHEFYYDGAYNGYNSTIGVKGYLTVGFFDIAYTYSGGVLSAELNSFYFLSNLQVVVSGTMPAGDYYLYSNQIRSLCMVDIYNSSYMTSGIALSGDYGSNGRIAGISNTDGLAFIGRLRTDGSSADYQIFLHNRTTDKTYRFTKNAQTLSSADNAQLVAIKIPFSEFELYADGDLSSPDFSDGGALNLN